MAIENPRYIAFLFLNILCKWWILHCHVWLPGSIHKFPAGLFIEPTFQCVVLLTLHFVPQKPACLHYFIWCQEGFFSKFWAPMFGQILSKPKQRPHFLHSLLFTKVHALSWLKLWHVFPTPLPCSNVCLEVLEKSKVAWTLLPHPTPPHPTLPMEVQETWQQRSMNVCTAREVGAA